MWSLFLIVSNQHWFQHLSASAGLVLLINSPISHLLLLPINLCAGAINHAKTNAPAAGCFRHHSDYLFKCTRNVRSGSRCSCVCVESEWTTTDWRPPPPPSLRHDRELARNADICSLSCSFARVCVWLLVDLFVFLNGGGDQSLFYDVTTQFTRANAML